MIGRTTLKALPAAGLCLLAATAATATATGVACRPGGRLIGHTVHFCGPATAHLAVFQGVTFGNGTCSTRRDGNVVFMLRLGTRTPNARTNNGRAYFGLSMTGSLSHPTGGGVIAYWKGRRWGGVGVSLSGTARSGRFVARGINGSRGTTSGSFRC